MTIAYLNHNTNSSTGAGRFYTALSAAMKKVVPNVATEALTTENILYPNKFKLLLALPAIKKILSRCDLIHALDGWPYGVIAAWANKTLKKPLIITAIGTGAVKPLYSWWRRPILKWAYRRADKVVAVSNNTKKEIQKFLPDLNIEVINHGVDYERFQVLGVQHQEIKKLRPYILSAGFIKERKGYEFSIRAFAAIADRYPKLNYAILGTDNYADLREYKRLSKLAEDLGVGDRVIFLSYDKRYFGGNGRIPDEELAVLYKNAELFILLPQDFHKDIEGFGLVFLEAAAAGLPVIATRETSAEDAVRDGQNGILVAPKDHQEAAVALDKILSDQKLRQKMSAESLKFAKEMSWEKAANSYKEIYSLLYNR